MLRLLSLLAFFLTVVQPALALPAPMSEGELLEKSDLVALVRVLSVICTSVTKDDRTGEDLPGYLAKFQVLEVKKGDAKPGDEVIVTWRAIPKGVLGPWAVYYYPGEEVWTHLARPAEGIAYSSTWWNARGEVVKKAETTELPTQVGMSVVMTGQ
ncbi:MAG: hypothetical protein ACREDO_00665 [Methyloceanibacter sp.]